jgi:hypothetical protein
MQFPRLNMILFDCAQGNQERKQKRSFDTHQDGKRRHDPARQNELVRQSQARGMVFTQCPSVALVGLQALR